MKPLFTTFILTIHILFVFAQNPDMYIPYRVGEKWTMANSSGKILFEPKFEETFPSTTNRIKYKQGENFGFINPKGEIVIKPIYSKVSDFYTFGGKTHSYVTLKDSSFFIDTIGKPITPIYGCGGVHSNRPNGLRVFEIQGKYGLIASRGDTVVQPTLKKIINYNDGKCVIAQDFNFKYGILSSRGDTIYSFSLDL